MKSLLTDALGGIKVIDFTQLAAGPVCTMLMGDMGADVVKIESPQGDMARHLGPPWANSESVMFISMNRNKRSIAIDLKQPEAIDLVWRLTRSADVVIESFRPGVMDRLGVGYERLRQEKSDLVYCAISAYGQRGPWRDKPGVDGIVQAASGLMSVTGEEGATPCKSQPPTIDMVTGFLALSAILAALRQRDQHGVGQMLDVNMYASALMLQQTSLAAYLHTLTVPRRSGSAAPYAAPNEAFQASDGFIMVAAYQANRWRSLCSVLEQEELAEDPRFADNAARVANRDALVAALTASFRQRSRSEWVERLERADILCSPVCDYSEVVDSAQVAHNGLLVQLDHPLAGRIRVPGFALGGSPRDGSLPRPSPLLAQHSNDILRDLGLDASAIASLIACGAVHAEPDPPSHAVAAAPHVR